MRRAIGLIIGLALVSPGHAVIGDLNRDGKVDLIDFFIFADNFGLRGEPEPVGVVTVTVRDTVEVERVVPVYVNVSVLATVYIEDRRGRASTPCPRVLE